MNEFRKKFSANIAVLYILYIKFIVTEIFNYLFQRENNELIVQRNNMRKR